MPRLNTNTRRKETQYLGEANFSYACDAMIELVIPYYNICFPVWDMIGSSQTRAGRRPHSARFDRKNVSSYTPDRLMHYPQRR